MVNIVWFQNDLRLHDHRALQEATQAGLPIIGLYAKKFSHPKAALSTHSTLKESYRDQTLMALKKALKAYHIPLLVFASSAAEALMSLAQSVKIQTVYGHYCASPFERYEAIRIQKNFTLQLYETETLIHPADLGFSLDTMPQGFTSFRKKVEKYLRIRPLIDTPLRPQEPLPVDASFNPKISPLIIEAGEDAGLQRLAYYLETKKIKTYKKTRNGMLRWDDSTKFSFYLSLGALSPRKIYHAIKAFERIHGKNESTYWVIFELLWRDFFKFQERKHPRAFYHQRGLQNKQIAWHDDPQIYQAITQGKTGFPLIDANIQQLLTTGYMSNRGRQNVASFWVKNVGLDWQLGERFFERHLLDYDAASNTGNWQYITGIGNDFVPFRFFDIVKQGQKYDPDTSYLLHYLPELQKVPQELRYQLGHLTPAQRALFAIDYPPPIIDFYDGLNQMKARYEKS